MPRALSLDPRERVIAAIEEGASCREAAERFSVGVATAIRWRARVRAEGELAAAGETQHGVRQREPERGDGAQGVRSG